MLTPWQPINIVTVAVRNKLFVTHMSDIAMAEIQLHCPDPELLWLSNALTKPSKEVRS